MEQRKTQIILPTYGIEKYIKTFEEKDKDYISGRRGKKNCEDYTKRRYSLNENGNVILNKNKDYNSGNNSKK